ATLGPEARQRMFRLACFLGLVAVLAFAYMIYQGGGLWQVYGRAKGSGVARSGYVGEAPLLAFPAIILLFVSRQGQRLHLRHLALVLLFASPYLIHGFLGTRRGPAFMVLAALMFSWCITSSRRPKLRTILIGLGLIGLTVLFLKSHRSQIFLGSDFDFDSSALLEECVPGEPNAGDNFIHSSGTVLTAHQSGRYGWGRNLLITYLVRPIPKQIWPTKYQDARLALYPNAEPNTNVDREAVLEWRPVAGA
ncbi:unnamed protein product, partial [marine sediment metagenome]